MEKIYYHLLRIAGSTLPLLILVLKNLPDLVFSSEISIFCWILALYPWPFSKVSFRFPVSLFLEKEVPLVKVGDF